MCGGGGGGGEGEFTPNFIVNQFNISLQVLAMLRIPIRICLEILGSIFVCPYGSRKHNLVGFLSSLICSHSLFLR